MPHEPAPQRTMPDPAALPRPWIGSYPPGVPPRYPIPDVAVTRLLDDAARDFPDVTATWFWGATLSYAELLRRADRLAAAFLALDVTPGSRVGVVLPDVPARPIVLFATWRVGAVAVPVDADASEADLHHDLDCTGCVAAVCLSAVVPRVNAVRGRLPALRHVVATGLEDWLPFPRDRLFPVTGRRSGQYYRLRPDDDVERLTALVERHRRVAGQVVVAPEDPAAIVHPEGHAHRALMLSHRNLLASALQVRLWIPDIQSGRERIVVAGTAPGAGGVTVGALTATLTAATLVLAPADGEPLRATVERTRPTILVGCPAAFGHLAETGARGLDAARVCLVLGALTPDLVGWLREHSGARLRAAYGPGRGPMTHANPVYGAPVDGSIGLPMTETVAAVVDPDDPARVLPPGSLGELIVHGPQIPGGYWRQPGPLAHRLHDGWLRTGDPATMDSDGWFAVDQGRRDRSAQ